MEHNHHDLHEAAHIADEALEDVTGGSVSSFGKTFRCPICNKGYMMNCAVNYQGKTICKTCFNDLQNGDAAAKARAL